MTGMRALVGHGLRAGMLVVLATAMASAQPAIMRNMWEGPVVLPGTDPRAPVEDTIAVDGVRLRDRIESQDLPNPLEPTPDVLADGEQLYGTYCAVCHGQTGQGDGQIASHFRRMPDLRLPHIQENYTDGWIYAIIREGGFNMPPLASQLSPEERWAVVLYVKSFETVRPQRRQ